MKQAAYDEIAGWYDQYLSVNPIYREHFLAPLWQLIGDVKGQNICDLACGQGWISRELARRGAIVTGIDVSEKMLALARHSESQEPLGIRYLLGDAQNADLALYGSFDGVVCVLSLMDIPDLQATLQAMRKLLKPGGRLVFVLTHPCFEAPHARWIVDGEGEVRRAVNGYFQEGFWKSVPPGGIRSRVGAYHRMLSTYLNALADAGFMFERMEEPIGSDERAQQVPGSREVPAILVVRARAL